MTEPSILPLSWMWFLFLYLCHRHNIFFGRRAFGLLKIRLRSNIYILLNPLLLFFELLIDREYRVNSIPRLLPLERLILIVLQSLMESLVVPPRLDVRQESGVERHLTVLVQLVVQPCDTVRCISGFFTFRQTPHSLVSGDPFLHLLLLQYLLFLYRVRVHAREVRPIIQNYEAALPVSRDLVVRRVYRIVVWDLGRMVLVVRWEHRRDVAGCARLFQVVKRSQRNANVFIWPLGDLLLIFLNTSVLWPRVCVVEVIRVLWRHAVLPLVMPFRGI